MKERTNRCKKLQLFNTKFLHSHFKPKRLTEKEDPSRTEQIMMNRLIAKSKDENLSKEYREACRQVAAEISKEHGDWWVPDEINTGRLINLQSVKEQKRTDEKSNLRSVAQFREWAERQSEITAAFSKAKIQKYVDARAKVNNQIEKQIEYYKDAIRQLCERIKRNEIQTQKRCCEVH